MKKIYLSFVTLAITLPAFAQWSNTSPHIYNMNSGHVGIGTTSPTSKLSVVGNMDFLTTTNSANNYIFQTQRTDGTAKTSFSSNAAGQMLFQTGEGPVNDFSYLTTSLFIARGGKIGIGTTTPFSNLQLGNLTAQSSPSPITLSLGATYSSLAGKNPKLKVFDDGSVFFGMGVSLNQLDYILSANQSDHVFYANTTELMRIRGNGKVGVGTTSPATRFHINGTGASLDGTTQYNGDGLAIQVSNGSRSTTNGAQIEFLIPVSTDGTNPWGQARILAVAANETNGNATGKLIMGTRRWFNKLNTGANWYYGNDIVIDGAGNVGIGTLSPKEALSVNGNIRSKQVKVETANWPDFVFGTAYQLPSLNDVKQYIDLNHHLPDMPSASDVEKDGLNLGETNRLLLQNVEELTLSLIKQNKQTLEQKKINDSLQKQIDQIAKKPN